VIVFFKKVKKTQQQISPSTNVLLFKLISAVIYENNCTVGLKQKFQIRHNRILSIGRISDFGKSVGFGIRHIPTSNDDRMN